MITQKANSCGWIFMKFGEYVDYEKDYEKLLA